MIVHFNYPFFLFPEVFSYRKIYLSARLFSLTYSLQQGGDGKISSLNKKSIGNILSSL
jgi:hypothetical protein